MSQLFLHKGRWINFKALQEAKAAESKAAEAEQAEQAEENVTDEPQAPEGDAPTQEDAPTTDTPPVEEEKKGPYICAVCNKETSSQWHLDKHFDSHTEEEKEAAQANKQ